MKQQLSTIMQKEVSRKQFLGMSGLAVASVFGLGGVLKIFSGQSLLGNNSGSGSGSGYGGSPYGR